MCEYDNNGPEAWAARVQRGVRLLDEALGTHAWREALAHFEVEAFDFGHDIVDQLCAAEPGKGMCRPELSHYAMQTYHLDLFSVGMDYAGDYEFNMLHRAWAIYLAADAELQAAA